jgi:hypothetical protein
VVVIIHRNKLAAGAALTAPYLITLGLTVVAALTGLADWRRRRPPLQAGGATMPGWVRTLQIIFVVAVAFIAAVVLYGPKPAMNARYFPEPLTSFTLDALGVFYLSLSLSVLFMIGQRGMATLVTYLRGASVSAGIRSPAPLAGLPCPSLMGEVTLQEAADQGSDLTPPVQVRAVARAGDHVVLVAGLALRPRRQ